MNVHSSWGMSVILGKDKKVQGLRVDIIHTLRKGSLGPGFNS